MSRSHERPGRHLRARAMKPLTRFRPWGSLLVFRSVVMVAALSLPGLALGAAPLSIGVLGDSYSDEYEFYPPDRARARNWVEILARARGLNFGEYSRASRGEPRNQGFAYNWARSGAETADLIRGGQHTGLAGQVSRGEVGVVVIFVGGNDFIHALASEERDRVADQVLRRAIANLDLAVKTILEASPRVQVFIATVPDVVELPMFAAPIRAGLLAPAVAARFSRAISRYNWHIRRLTTVNRRIALLDLALATRLAPRPDGDHVVVVGRRLNRIHPANDVDHAFLADSRHVNLLVQGVLANYLINAVNARLDARIEQLSLREIFAQDPGAASVTLFDSRSLPGRFRTILLGPLGRELLGMSLGLRLGFLAPLGENR